LQPPSKRLKLESQSSSQEEKPNRFKELEIMHRIQEKKQKQADMVERAKAKEAAKRKPLQSVQDAPKVDASMIS